MTYPIILDGDRSILQNKWLSGFEGDCLHLRAPSSIIGCEIIDNSKNNQAHRDAIQLIPSSKKGLYNQQYALSTLSDILIFENSIESIYFLQGVFSSDGLYEDISIINNMISTNSAHHITINGLLSGVISGNTDRHDNPSPVVLNPARIGGKMGRLDKNVWVSSFEDFDYEDIECENLTDNRNKKNRSGDVYLDNFRLRAFRKSAINLVYKNTRQYCSELKELAINFGDVS